MVAFYLMIVRAKFPFMHVVCVCSQLIQAICAWFYPGQPELGIMLNCPESVATALAGGVGEGAGDVSPEIVARIIGSSS